MVVGWIQYLGDRSLQEDFCGFRSNDMLQLCQAGPADAMEVSQPLVAVVCDGMGGHSAGEVASRVAGERFLTSTGFLDNADRLVQGLQAGCDDANDAVGTAQGRSPERTGMGTTLVGFCIQDRLLSWVSVGDSALFLYRRGALFRVNADHSMKPVLDQMLAQGIISRQDHARHPDRNALRSVVGGDRIPLLDLCLEGIPLQKGDWVLACSDGLQSITEDVIRGVISRWRFFGVERCLRRLVAAVRRARAKEQDNVTILVVRI